MDTDPSIINALKSSFPAGSPNITVSDPWVKKAETCSWKTDSNLVHHFEDTVYIPTNDVCSLSPGLYTWIVTSDYQLSFGKFANVYEFASKHSNLALMRTGYVAGEFAVIAASPENKAMIYWNLLSVSIFKLSSCLSNSIINNRCLFCRVLILSLFLKT